MNESKRVIVLLHGFAAHRLMMVRLATHFQQAGFETLNWGYPSWFKPIEFHAERLAQRVRELDHDPAVGRIDFVTHSMGCIVTRSALLKQLPNKCGRWVMLAPPNQGSLAANRLAPPFGWLMKPLVELQAKADSYVNRLGVPQGLEMAVIQASKDFIVSESLTYLEKEKDRFVVPTLHSAMLLRKDVAEESLHFLEHGRFSRSSALAESRVAT